MPPRTHKLASEHMNRYAVYVALTRHRDGVALSTPADFSPQKCRSKIPVPRVRTLSGLCHFPVVVPVVWQPGQMWVE